MKNNYNYILYKIPIEIIPKIIDNLNEIQDLINFYDVFDKYKKYIMSYINEYSKYRNNNINHSLSYIIYKDKLLVDIDDDYTITDEEDKDDYLQIIKILYEKHIIYKKIIETILKCHECKYIFNLYDVRHIYICKTC